MYTTKFFGWDAIYSQGFGGCVGPLAYIKDSVSAVQQMEPRTEAMSLYLSVYLYIYIYLSTYLSICIYAHVYVYVHYILNGKEVQ